MISELKLRHQINRPVWADAILSPGRELKMRPDRCRRESVVA